MVNLRWKAWGGTQAKATGQRAGQKVGDPSVEATFIVSGEDCGDFVVYTTMTVITNAGAYPVRLDGDCEHLSPVPESASPPASKPDPVASELERQRQQLEQQQRER